jgi:hypothetical protein
MENDKLADLEVMKRRFFNLVAVALLAIPGWAKSSGCTRSSTDVGDPSEGEPDIRDLCRPARSR